MTLDTLKAAVKHSPTFAIKYVPEHRAIAEIAYQLWNESGRIEGNDLYFWYKAEDLLDNYFWAHCTEDIIDALQGSL